MGLAPRPRREDSSKIAPKQDGFDFTSDFSQSDGLVSRPSFLLSFLAIQSTRQGAKFADRHAGAWLVWEPGTWQPPSRAMLETMGVSRDTSKATKPTATDALCFSLGTGPVVTVGRAQENDCVVSDATVSRQHVELVFGHDGWTVRPAERRQFELNGRVHVTARKLAAFDQLGLGNVVLTFVPDHHALLSRMAK